MPSSTRPGTLILPDYLIDRPGQPPKPGWGVRLVGTTVDAVAPHRALRQTHPEDEVWRARQQALSPGFVDAHTHLTALLIQGIPPPEKGDAGTFQDMHRWRRMTDRLDGEMIEVAVESALFHCLRSGVTTIAEVISAPPAVGDALERVAHLAAHWGVRAVVSRAVCSQNWEANLHENAVFIDAGSQTTAPALLRGAVVIGSHAHAQAHAAAQSLVEATRVPLLVHTTEAVQVIQTPAGESRVYTPLTEFRLADASPVHLDPVASPVGLGSDGSLYDFFRVMRSAWRQSRHASRGNLLTAGEIWQMATAGGAGALGLSRVGRLEPGWQADLQLIDLTFPTPVAAENLYDQLLRYGGPEHVRAVLIAGTPRVIGGVVLNRDGTTVRERAIAAARRLWKSVQDPQGVLYA